MKSLIHLVLFSFLPGLLYSATPIPPGAETLFPVGDLSAMNFQQKDCGEMAMVSVAGMPFTEAARVTTTTQPLKWYHISLKSPINDPLKKGDALLVSVWARNVGAGHNDTGLGEVTFIMKGKSLDLAKYSFTPGQEWQQFLFSFAVPTDIPAKSSNIALCFGAMPQTIEIGGFELLNYGPAKKVSDLPRTEITYAGREPDAPWRKLAEERIEKHRKSDLTVVVKDEKGNPVPDARVHVVMKRHAFLFGAAMTGRAFDESEVTRPLLENHKQLFNQGLPIQSFVWSIYDTSEGEAEADKFMKYFAENKQATRGHVLLWERLNVMPPDVVELIKNKDAEKLRERISSHIRETVTKYKGHMDEWVVENEAVDNSAVRKVLGEASIAEWFKIARAADPDAKLMINENRVEHLNPYKQARLLELCKTIQENGGDFDIIGIQGHVGSIPTPIEVVLKNFDRLAAPGKELAITEYDFDSEEAGLKADYTRDFMTAVFSHPSFTSFTIWRFWDGQPHFHESVIFAHDWTLRPSGQVYKDLVFKKWWTDVEGKTDADGKFTARGFFGDYTVTVTAGGKTKVVETELRKGRPDVWEIKFP